MKMSNREFAQLMKFVEEKNLNDEVQAYSLLDTSILVQKNEQVIARRGFHKCQWTAPALETICQYHLRVDISPRHKMLLAVHLCVYNCLKSGGR